MNNEAKTEAVPPNHVTVEGPEIVFTDDAQRLFARITELETSGAPAKHIRKAREHANKALAEMDAAFSALR